MRATVERQAPPEQEVEFILADLFRGMTLTDAELEDARAIVRADVVARREIPPPPPGEPMAAWSRGVALMAQRDEALAALLLTDAQRAMFGENAAAQRRMIEEVLSRAKRQDGGGSVAG